MRKELWWTICNELILYLDHFWVHDTSAHQPCSYCTVDLLSAMVPLPHVTLNNLRASLESEHWSSPRPRIIADRSDWSESMSVVQTRTLFLSILRIHRRIWLSRLIADVLNGWIRRVERLCWNPWYLLFIFSLDRCRDTHTQKSEHEWNGRPNNHDEIKI